MLIGTFRRECRQRRKKKASSTSTRRETTSTLSRHRTACQEQTWSPLITIAYFVTEAGCDIMRAAVGAFDSQCAIDMMSRTYAADILGVYFDDTNCELIGYTFTDEPIYSVGRLKARWTFAQESSSGDEPVLAPLFYTAEFYVVDTSHYEVIIGHQSLVKNKIYERKARTIAPFRSVVKNPGSSPATDVDRDQSHAAAVAAQLALMGQFEQQQVRKTCAWSCRRLTRLGPKLCKEVAAADT